MSSDVHQDMEDAELLARAILFVGSGIIFALQPSVSNTDKFLEGLDHFGKQAIDELNRRLAAREKANTP